MCIVYHNSGFISSTMPELHINGRSTYHNFSLENNANGASYDTSSSFMVTGRSHNSTIALSTTTNTMDSENSACGIVSFFIFFIFFFAVVIIIVIGIWLVRKKIYKNSGKSGIQSVTWNGPSFSSQLYKIVTEQKKPYKWLKPQCDKINVN